MKQYLHRLDYRLSIGRVLQIAAVGLLLAASVAQIMGQRSASAAQITNRKVTISSSKISETGVSYAFAFTIPTAGQIQGIRFQFCTTPLGSCTAPAGFSAASASVNGTQTFTNATAFTDNGSLDEGDCTENTNSANEFCAERADTNSETAVAKAITLDGITNPNTQTTVYVRIGTYSDTAFGTPVDSGVVAAATARQLTTNGRVQERLVFCVEAIGDTAALPADCTAMGSTTTIDIGVIDNTAVNQSPVDTTATNGANDSYGVAQVNTNASNGVVLSYFPEAAGTGTNELRAFRVSGATCNASGTDTTDQCFIQASGSGETFAAGTERFGLAVPCIDTTQGITSNMGSVPGAYNGSDNSTTSGADCENEANTDWAWSNSGTAATLASSSTVVDDEIVKIRFGATAAATTPTGQYTVTTTYIATPTY